MKPAGAPVPLAEQKHPPVPRGPNFSKWGFVFDKRKVCLDGVEHSLDTPNVLLNDEATAAIEPPAVYLTHNKTFDNILIAWDGEWLTYPGRPTMPKLADPLPPPEEEIPFKWVWDLPIGGSGDGYQLGAALLLGDASVLIDGYRHYFNQSFRREFPNGEVVYRDGEYVGYERPDGRNRFFYAAPGYINERFKVPLTEPVKTAETESSALSLAGLRRFLASLRMPGWLNKPVPHERLVLAGMWVAFAVAIAVVAAVFGRHP